MNDASHLNKAEAKQDSISASVGIGSPDNTVRQATVFRDYEPEAKYGTAHDFQEHTRFGGTKENY